MPLLDSPWANALLGLASIKNPNLLQSVMSQQGQQQDRARQAQEDKRRRDWEDYQRKIAMDKQASLGKIGGLLSSSSPYVTRESEGPPQLMGRQEQAGPPQMIPGGFPSTQGPPSLEYPQSQPLLGPQPTEQYSRKGLLASELVKAGQPALAKDFFESQFTQQSSGPFTGNTSKERMLKTVFDYETAVNQGKKPSQQDTYAYNLAKWELESNPSYVGTPETGYIPIQPPKLPGMQGSQQQAPRDQGQAIPPLKTPAVVEKARSEYEAKKAGLSTLENAVNTLVSAVKEKGTEYSIGPLNAASAQDMSAKATDVMIELKNLFELGALQKPDIEIMEKALLDPASLKGNWKGSGAVMSGLNTILNKVKSQHGVIDKQYSRFGFNDKKDLKSKYGLE